MVKTAVKNCRKPNMIIPSFKVPIIMFNIFRNICNSNFLSMSEKKLIKKNMKSFGYLLLMLDVNFCSGI